MLRCKNFNCSAKYNAEDNHAQACRYLCCLMDTPNMTVTEGTTQALLFSTKLRNGGPAVHKRRLTTGKPFRPFQAARRANTVMLTKQS